MGRKRFFLFPILFILFIAAKSAIVMLIWNCLVPEAFHGPELTYLQAIELSVLVRVLIGFHGGRHHWRHHRKMHRHFSHLSPEEKAELSSKLKEND